MLSRRGFLGSASATAVLAAVPGAASAALSLPDPVAVKSSVKFACDPLAAKLYSKRLAIEAIQGTYLNSFLGTSAGSLIQERRS